MGEAVAQARRQVDLSREALAADVDRFEARLRAELDWKARLRRDGPRLAAALGGVAVLAVGAVLLRRRLGGSRSRPDRLADPERVAVRDLVLEIKELRDELERNREDKGAAAVVRRAAVGALTSAATAGGRAAARRFVQGAERETAAAR